VGAAVRVVGMRVGASTNKERLAGRGVDRDRGELTDWAAHVEGQHAATPPVCPVTFVSNNGDMRALLGAAADFARPWWRCFSEPSTATAPAPGQGTIPTVINWNWALTVHGPARALAAFAAAMDDPGAPALFTPQIACRVDDLTLSYHGKATQTGDDQRLAVMALSAAHPELALAALTRGGAGPGGAVTLTSYLAGAAAGCSRSGRYNALLDGAVAWLPSGSGDLYRLTTTAAAVVIPATGDGLFDALAQVAHSVGGRTALVVVAHPSPGTPLAPGADIATHPGLEVTPEPEPATDFLGARADPGYTVRLSLAAFAAARLAGYLVGARARVPFRAAILDRILAADADPLADTAALMHLTYLSAAGATPPPAEHDALTALAAATAPGGRRPTLSALHALLSTIRDRGEVEWADSINALIAALAPAQATA